MRVIRDVLYRHIAGYLQVTGPTQKGALQNAKKVGTLLLSRLPEALVRPPRLKEEGAETVYEVPVLLGKNPSEVRSVLASIVLADLG